MEAGLRRFGAGAALAAVTVIGAMGAVSFPERETNRETAASESASTPVIAATDTAVTDLSRAFRGATQRALPGVVHVRVETGAAVRAGVPQSPFEGTPFEDFFRQRQPEMQPRQQQPRMGSGSGFVFRSDGYILTNNHVVDGATRVTVIFQDRRELDAEVIGRDPNTDIAVVKVDANDLPALVLGDSDRLQVGDWVVALGYPLSLGSTVTAGIVSAKGKSLGIIGRDQQASAPLEHFIQTDAAINPGNSGGPLVDLNGRVVGINSAIASPTGYYSGYGFAVPITLAERVAEDLIEHGQVRRPKLGIAIRDPSLADAEAAGLKRPLGALVASVEAGSPADEAGLELNDAIVAVEDRTVESAGDLMELVARQEPGESVTLTVVRQGQRISVEVDLDDSFAPAVAVADRERETDSRGVARLGFEATEVTPRIARELGLRSAEGVAVTAVDPTSAAARAGLRPGMLLESVNGSRVESRSDLEKLAADLHDGQIATLIVRLPAQDGSSRTVLNFRVSR